MKFQEKVLYFFAVFFTNLILKSLFISDSSYSYDEIISVKDTLLNFGHIKHEAEWDNNPPFYYYCLWIWHQIFPITEFYSRLLSVIFMSIAFGLFFNFLLKYHNFRVALATIVLLGLSNFMTFYAQETRAYALVVLLTVISTICFFRYIENPTVLNILVFSLVDFLLIYTHYITGLILMFQFFYILIFEKEIRKRFLIISISTIVLLIYIRFTKKQFINIFNYNHKSDFWLLPANFSDLISASNTLYFNVVGSIVFIFILGYYCFNFRALSFNGRHKLDSYYIFIGFGATLILFLVGTIKAVFLSRYLIFVVPFATVFVIQVVERSKKYAFTVLVPVLALLLINFNLYKEASMDYKRMSNVIKNVKQDSDVVIVNRKDNLALFLFYLDREKFLKYKNYDSLANSQNIFALNEASDMNLLEGRNFSKVILIQSFHKLNNNSNVCFDYLNSQYKNYYHSNFFNGIELSAFKN